LMKKKCYRMVSQMEKWHGRASPSSTSPTSHQRISLFPEDG
jgi:hypothetical protein